MIYLDTSVLLAQLFAEDRCPPPELWAETLTSSRLLEYETWSRLYTHKLAERLGERARQLLARVAMLELAPPVLTRALDPFPVPLRTLDALHLASADYLRRQGQTVRLATYDQRLAAVTEAIGIPLYPLE